jgi:hypothetical protein
MGKTLRDAVIIEPERFLGYLSSDQEEKIRSSTTQEEAIERLKDFMKIAINPQDPRGSRFEDEEVFDEPEVLMRLYNEFFKAEREAGERPSPEVGVLKTTKEVSREMELITAVARSIKDVPAAQRVRMGGYRRKGYKAAKSYERSRPRPWSLKEKEWLARNKHIRDGGLLTKLRNAQFPDSARTKSSVQTMKYRIKKGWKGN